MKKWTGLNVILISFFILTVSCKKKDADLPDNLAAFESTEFGIAQDAADINIKIRLSRPTDIDIPIVIQLVPQGLVYTIDFTTTPAASGDKLTVTVPAGSSETNFKVNKATGSLFDGDEKLGLKIQSAASPTIIGTVSELNLSFAEIISEQATMTINGGGATYGNKVFIDLSANRQTAVERTKWDLGFYTGDEFRVVLNSSTGMMARALDKTDLTAVTAADTANFDQEMSFNAFSRDALAYIDYPDGDLSKTAIAAVSDNAEENKVYIVYRGVGIGTPTPSRGWKKIRVLRNSAGAYILQHADIGASTFEEVTITKAPDHFFTYTSFEDGAVDVAPEKNKWDIAWTYFTNITSDGVGEIPYGFQDFIIQNRNIETVKVLSNTTSYESFAEANLAGLSFSSLQNGIGSDWRAGGGPNSAPAIRTDRFYIIKDADNNYYKLRFTALTQDGERGHPSLEYALVKKGRP